MQLQLDEVRRLTGPNLLWNKPGAIVDVFISHGDGVSVVGCWQHWAGVILSEFGWQQDTTYRLHAQGANMALSAPLDALYTACGLAELAWDCCLAEMNNQPLPDWQHRLAELRLELAQEVNPALLSLVSSAKENNVTSLCDDDRVSLGMGASVSVWPVVALPKASAVNWRSFSDIPVAFITGTNGKSTSVRLAAEMAKAAGLVAGVTSTDFIRVGDDIIDHGDYSGPGGARMLLRDPRTDIAFLEVARGGLLRRGLPVERVEAALITNVASDHLGQYGINTLEALAEVKFMVSKGLNKKAVLVVNADNALVVNQALKTAKTLCWFSLDENNSLIKQQIESGGRAVFVRSGMLVYHADGRCEDVCSIVDIPMTFNGNALHNVENALGVVGLAKALQLPHDAIKSGLLNFGSNALDNPGRGNRYRVKGCDVIVDFAHNEHSVSAVVSMVNRMPAQKRIVMFSHAGDRSDDDIKSLTEAVIKLQPSAYVVSEIEHYLRGRVMGEIPALVQDILNNNGVPSQAIGISDTPLLGAQKAIKQAEPGDVILLFVLDQRDQVHQWLSDQSDVG